MEPPAKRVAAVWRGDPRIEAAETRNQQRLAPIFSAMRDEGIGVQAVLYSDEAEQDLVEQLESVDGVLVWVDPISDGHDRTALDEILRDVASRGTWVSAHPDTITRMGTKRVLYDTRHVGWGGDTRLYSTMEQLRRRFPQSLATGRARVLKQHRGNGGVGVWKVVLIDPDRELVRVQHAAPRDDRTEDLPLTEFLERCAPYLARDGTLVDQLFAERLPEGLIRAYLVEREVVGFARQRPVDRSVDPKAPSPDQVLGLPSAKTMYDADEPEFRALRSLLEGAWVAELGRIVDVRDDELPVLWDADFLYGPRTDEGADTYVLCEINVSSVIPFPPRAPAKVASAVRRRLATR